LYVKLEKCAFHQPQVEYFGYIIFDKGRCMDFMKMQTIMDWTIPTTIQDVLCFLGFANFYIIFMKDYSRIIIPFTQLNFNLKEVRMESCGAKIFSRFKKYFHSNTNLDPPRFL
jgi:hypothetical protein